LKLNVIGSHVVTRLVDLARDCIQALDIAAGTQAFLAGRAGQRYTQS